MEKRQTLLRKFFIRGQLCALDPNRLGVVKAGRSDHRTVAFVVVVAQSCQVFDLGDLEVAGSDVVRFPKLPHRLEALPPERENLRADLETVASFGTSTEITRVCSLTSAMPCPGLSSTTATLNVADGTATAPMVLCGWPNSPPATTGISFPDSAS